MVRTCSRTGCSRTAAVTMSYGYAERTAWLVDLDSDQAPPGYDLCAEHADAFTVPRGWRREDDRVGTGSRFSRRAG